MFYPIFNKQKKTNRSKLSLARGFTIIEALVAIVILLIAILGPLAMLASAISDSHFARNQVVATFLSQEGLEMALPYFQKEIVDGSMQDRCGTVDNYCIIDIKQNKITIEESTDPALYITDDSPKKYVSIINKGEGDAKTIFSRKIWFNLVSVNDPDLANTIADPDVKGEAFIGLKITSQVTWSYRGVSKTAQSSIIYYEPFE
ncbi:MAG: hypothetical protein A2370_01435 [Candidatus Vogelbacteria bacterium RIFOXYB1_FULL_42_16]|uniref:Prepilin-type N-terminal cleavage/methylation domain-containing protein n=1 Tax=Candidatus Vogelbacteria bacterium RIFOXYB1_FULL_42_16 TaxID=1802436 RepID=A0A1G2QD44_9BACT|nr:MAG: hypothetical protein UV50_C0004G0025 [Parcubacteria group bacterium GW2011_GWB1_42_9]OHA58358.1 MAG: hypothetical protein A2370_01435 [Candidatus Vogelbacteria bacterium RIFOXYB1_FULL_42_16]